MSIVKKQHKQVDEYLNHKSKTELSLETQVFLSFKHRTPNRYKLLDKLIRANITPEEELTEKTVYLGEKAKKLLRTILKKLFSNRYVLINHKYITRATRCKSDQNTIILKELERILKIKFYRLYTNNKGTKFSRHYYIELHPVVVDELKDTGHDNSEFYPEKNRPTYTNRNIFNKDKYIDLESNFLQNSEELGTQKNTEPQVAIFPQEHAKPVKLKKNLSNKRKKPTNTERKERIYHFNQYKEPQGLSYHYPLTKEDGDKLQSLSGRDFSLNAMNEILLDMSKRLDNRFYSKAQFIAYFGTCLKYEKRDAVKTSNDNFCIKANITPIGVTTEFGKYPTLREIVQEKQVEQYLAEIEQRAIIHVCPENQLKARLANVLEPLRSYELLSNIKDFKVFGNTMRIYLRSQLQLNDSEKSIVLSQVQSIYSNSEFDIEGVEYVVENVYKLKSTNEHGSMQTKKEVDLPLLQQSAWGDVCRQLIKTYGIHIYNNWFSKLIPVINEDAKTIVLKAPNLFIQQWVETNYGEGIRNIIKKLGLELKELFSSSELKRGY
jgi:DnaA N-terminal domain